MKKVSYLILFITITIFLNACAGYKPIFSSANLNFNINDYSIEGDEILGNNIYSKLRNLSKSKTNDQNEKNLNFVINVLKNKNATTKDSAGKILEYKISISTKIKVSDSDTNNIILDHNFVSSISYKVKDQYSETIETENRLVETLMDKTYRELLIKLSENIITK